MEPFCTILAPIHFSSPSSLLHILFPHYYFTDSFIFTCRGYMAPEYVVLGKLTEKADVYSFGVLIMEIISGKKSTSFVQNSYSILHRVTLIIIVILLLVSYFCNSCS